MTREEFRKMLLSIFHIDCINFLQWCYTQLKKKKINPYFKIDVLRSLPRPKEQSKCTAVYHTDGVAQSMSAGYNQNIAAHSLSKHFFFKSQNFIPLHLESVLLLFLKELRLRLSTKYIKKLMTQINSVKWWLFSLFICCS